MTGATGIKKIQYIESGDEWNPFTESSNQAQSVEDAMFSLPTSVGSVTERNLLFGNAPKQGQAAYRTDLGMVERYFENFNAVSNPGGSVAGAGWYPESGRVPFFEVFGRPNGQSIGSGWVALNGAWSSPTINRGYKSFTGGVLTVETSGIYQVSCAWASASGVAAGNRGIQMTKNTTALDTANTITKLESQGLGSNISFPVQLNAGDALRFFVKADPFPVTAVAFLGDTFLRVAYQSLY